VSVSLMPGDCREVIKTLADDSLDSCVTDPPYSLQTINKRFAKVGRNDKTWSSSGPHQRTARGFMNKTWDTGEVAHDADFWAEVYRALKPGAYLVAFGGTRTYHRMVCAIEDAGFEIRDTVAWLYGTGFPKSHDVSKAIDKAAGAEREVMVREWEGWGTALKPAFEPIVLARKPLIGTVAVNVLAHGTGAINIDGCRIDTEEIATIGTPSWGGPMKRLSVVPGQEGKLVPRAEPHNLGRWPANVAHDGSDEVLAAFPDSAGQQGDIRGDEPSVPAKGDVVYGFRERVPFKRRDGEASANRRYTDTGATNFAATPGARRAPENSAARFFFSAKAGREDRFGSKHPTVKPVDLIRWLMRLVTPPGGTVLDPFAGSGTAGVAGMAEGFDAILIEREPEYITDIEARLAHYRGEGAHSLAVKNRNRKNKPSENDAGLFSDIAAD
jgi:DNA modification methylase